MESSGTRPAGKGSGGEVTAAKGFLLTSPLTCWTSGHSCQVSPSSSKGCTGEKAHDEVGSPAGCPRSAPLPRGPRDGSGGAAGSPLPPPPPPLSPAPASPGAAPAPSSPGPARPAVAALGTPQPPVGNETPRRGSPPPCSGPQSPAGRRSLCREDVKAGRLRAGPAAPPAARPKRRAEMPPAVPLLAAPAAGTGCGAAWPSATRGARPGGGERPAVLPPGRRDGPCPALPARWPRVYRLNFERDALPLSPLL